MSIKIRMEKVATYKNVSELKLEKRVGLVYGLNGSGKSTISNYLYDQGQDDYQHCHVELDGAQAIVYNQQFITDHFYEESGVPGVFTLAKENKDAQNKINAANDNIARLDAERREISKEFDAEREKRNAQIDAHMDEIWDLHKNSSHRPATKGWFSGKGVKKKLYEYLGAMTAPTEEPERSREDILREAEALSGTTQPLSHLTLPKTPLEKFERSDLPGQRIIGTSESPVAGLIEKLGHSDWVREGLQHSEDSGNQCPFCQESTFSDKLRTQLEQYFDKEFERKLQELHTLKSDYEKGVAALPNEKQFEIDGYDTSKIQNSLRALRSKAEANLRTLTKKTKSPAESFRLDSSTSAWEELSREIQEVNEQIKKDNDRIANREATAKELEAEFWQRARFDLNRAVESIQKLETAQAATQTEYEKKAGDIADQIAKQHEDIAKAQKQTINVNRAIGEINDGLRSIGIEDFLISEHSTNRYKLTRNDGSDAKFKSLSEGEKMLISFLYFCARCRGRGTATEIIGDRVVVIDDPVSSLSNLFVFSIGRIIIQEFLKEDQPYKHVIVFSHNLYFFYEIADINKCRRNEQQEFFRITKNQEGSRILEMKYEEIQNDYQSYWSVIKDESHPPILLANCMRNIIEYFFNFVEKIDFADVFQKKELLDNRFQAFNRFMNRESHSKGQNLLDSKDFEYESFREGLKLVFELNGYPQHYKRMLKKIP